jgi:methylamine utilization protein MauE
MILPTVLREVAGNYLIITLSATGLAKAQEWRNTSHRIAVEGVLPRSTAFAATVTISAAEVALAALLAARQFPRTIGFMTAGLFIAFAAYKLAVVAKTGKDSCNCTGTNLTYKATRPGIVASISASLVQAGCGCTWAVVPASRETALAFLSAAVFSIPIVMFARRNFLASSKDVPMPTPTEPTRAI